MENELNIALPQTAGEKRVVNVTVPGESLRPEGVTTFELGPVTVTGELFETSGQYLFQGHIRGAYASVCDRCIEAFQEPFDLEATWVFEPGHAAEADPDGAEDEDEFEEDKDFPDFIFFEGTSIDLRPVVWEEIVLDAPSKHLCHEDCAGLCPRCGANLNRETCTCGPEQEMKNNGLAALGNLFPGLKPKHSED
ncbi:MAG: hypothetical protein QG656_1850 [Candidatus Hydrogenedentes bacterium]|nr:hypothetical protein [Candidatus Hydrogenedentota bacterium]